MYTEKRSATFLRILDFATNGFTPDDMPDMPDGRPDHSLVLFVIIRFSGCDRDHVRFEVELHADDWDASDLSELSCVPRAVQRDCEEALLVVKQADQAAQRVHLWDLRRTALYVLHALSELSCRRGADKDVEMSEQEAADRAKVEPEEPMELSQSQEAGGDDCDSIGGDTEPDDELSVEAWAYARRQAAIKQSSPSTPVVTKKRNPTGAMSVPGFRDGRSHTGER